MLLGGDIINKWLKKIKATATKHLEAKGEHVIRRKYIRAFNPLSLRKQQSSGFLPDCFFLIRSYSDSFGTLNFLVRSTQSN